MPSEMSVSMVAAPWRRFIHAARWNGHAPHSTTGTVRANASHCQFVNCSAGITDSSNTGAAERVETRRRWRRRRERSWRRRSSVRGCPRRASDADRRAARTSAV